MYVNLYTTIIFILTYFCYFLHSPFSIILRGALLLQLIGVRVSRTLHLTKKKKKKKKKKKNIIVSKFQLMAFY
jgi:hypothetical protein